MPNCITEETIHNSMTDSRRELTGFNYRSYSTKRPSCIKKKCTTSEEGISRPQRQCCGAAPFTGGSGIFSGFWCPRLMLATLLLIQYFDLNFDSNSIPVPVTVNKFSYFVNRWSRAAPSQQKNSQKNSTKIPVITERYIRLLVLLRA